MGHHVLFLTTDSNVWLLDHMYIHISTPCEQYSYPCGPQMKHPCGGLQYIIGGNNIFVSRAMYNIHIHIDVEILAGIICGMYNRGKQHICISAALKANTVRPLAAYTYIHTCIRIRIRIRIRIPYTYMYVCMYVYIYIYIYMYVYVYVYTYAYIYIYIYVSLSLSLYIYIYIYMYIYI